MWSEHEIIVTRLHILKKSSFAEFLMQENSLPNALFDIRDFPLV